MLNPIIVLPTSQGLVLQNVAVTAGANVINHKLGRKLQGWYPTRVRAATALYDTQDSNKTPDLTLQLTATNNATIDLFVF